MPDSLLLSSDLSMRIRVSKAFFYLDRRIDRCDYDADNTGDNVNAEHKQSRDLPIPSIPECQCHKNRHLKGGVEECMFNIV